MTKLSSGRATILGALVVSDTKGTSLILNAVSTASVTVPASCQGAIIYGSLSNDTSFRLRFGTGLQAATADAGFFREETEYVISLNPSITTISGILKNGSGTAEVTWILGAGA